MELNEVFESTINPAPSRCKVLFGESESPRIGFIFLKDFCRLVEEGDDKAEWGIVDNVHKMLKDCVGS